MVYLWGGPSHLETFDPKPEAPAEYRGAQGAIATASGIVMAAATGLSGLLYAGSGSLAYLAMAAMALAGLGAALFAGRRWRG